ncbi:MAG: apolipoprotein N-acyltransferase [Bacteroidales bacterium]|jgi:apolipoprotein N-acyltransferase|nr:apolipoprotein N-acyltransferase [Bacteroidales bacterium]
MAKTKTKRKKRSSKNLLLAVLSGLLLALAWPTYGFSPLIFIGFVPLLLIERDLMQYVRKYSWLLLRYSFIAFLIFNVITCWWIGKVAFAAGIATCLLNAIVMTFFFQVYHIIRASIYDNRSRGQWILIPIWICFEFLHYNWELNFPWLNLGNVFATSIKLIQWYDVTGVLGGSLWVLLTNVFVFKAIDKWLRKDRQYAILGKRLLIPLTIIFVPIIISLIRFHTYKEVEDPITVVVYQPNSDPFNEKFSLSANEFIDRLFIDMQDILGVDVDLIVCPETALQAQLWEHEIDKSSYISRIRKGLETKASNAGMVMGASTYKLYQEGEEHKPYTKKFSSQDVYYDSFNTNIYIDTSNILQIYHKSKLTPGVEIMPYIRYLKFLENLALDLGGTVGSLGYDEEQNPFVNEDMSVRIAPIICYESLFGEHVSNFVRNGANLITISTNDGWWGNTQGHKQHCAYASLLAIETRRSIARSANTGISCTVNQRGEISNATEYWEQAVFKDEINLNTKKTFYVRYGDYVAHISLIILIVLVIISFINSLVLKRVERIEKVM